ncbi:endonuclease/exonuclease/phosphatase family protein [Bacillus sp. PS06]|uniref:endonuclease/exonuclease/phosphatase family protein n=1 Tax=Bacillus sp. PS06 TaxID=2764176 RepID=UPI00178195C0|nr:endonuclease/exonuclease/phosphatase family protein [Bacillus sp. PS06]MBD8067883.1 endonuclease/exonuclease/phosphatase family protein [Bacillus sp. PS06]
MSSNKQCLRVMTFNIHHGQGHDKKLDLQRISEVISKSNADIIGLNEVDCHFSLRSHFIDQLRYLANKNQLYHVFSPSITIERRNKQQKSQYGNALLSRFPIHKHKNHLFQLRSPFTEGRSILETTIDVNGRKISCYVTHLSLHPLLHKKQSQFILSKYHEPAIVLGDWNMRSGSSKWIRMTQMYTDAWNIAGNGAGNTYPSTKPRTRLDYIFVTKGIQINEAVVFSNTPVASDHLPVLATITI